MTHTSKLKCPQDNLKQDQHAVEEDSNKQKNALGDYTWIVLTNSMDGWKTGKFPERTE